MAPGEGKGWAKGRRASDDPRIAKNAQARRGTTYRLRGGAHPFDRPRPLAWTPRLAYAVGLAATDGNLSGDRRHLVFDSNDAQLVELFLRCVGRPVHYGPRTSRTGGVAYRAAFSDVELYRWFVSIGLTPAKSLTLGAIDVPEEFLLPVVRGLLDGDGSIVNFVHRPTKRLQPSYRYERLMAQFSSASRAHLEWLRARLEPRLRTRGYIDVTPPRPPRHEFNVLRYGKYASIELFGLLYPDPSVPRLLRKWATWEHYRVRNGADGGT
ncbi:MAG: hypothetical protein QOH08_2254 [Chloroflexota bacterium]|nr:hypothetical protein [Chloroflexota bacterium]